MRLKEENVKGRKGECKGWEGKMETHLDNSCVAYWGHESLQPHTFHFLYVHPCMLVTAGSLYAACKKKGGAGLLLFCYSHMQTAWPKPWLLIRPDRVLEQKTGEAALFYFLLIDVKNSVRDVEGCSPLNILDNICVIYHKQSSEHIWYLFQ